MKMAASRRAYHRSGYFREGASRKVPRILTVDKRAFDEFEERFWMCHDMGCFEEGGSKQSRPSKSLAELRRRRISKQSRYPPSAHFKERPDFVYATLPYLPRCENNLGYPRTTHHAMVPHFNPTPKPAHFGGTHHHTPEYSGRHSGNHVFLPKWNDGYHNTEAAPEFYGAPNSSYLDGTLHDTTNPEDSDGYLGVIIRAMVPDFDGIPKSAYHGGFLRSTAFDGSGTTIPDLDNVTKPPNHGTASSATAGDIFVTTYCTPIPSTYAMTYNGTNFTRHHNATSKNPSGDFPHGTLQQITLNRTQSTFYVPAEPTRLMRPARHQTIVSKFDGMPTVVKGTSRPMPLKVPPRSPEVIGFAVSPENVSVSKFDGKPSDGRIWSMTESGINSTPGTPRVSTGFEGTSRPMSPKVPPRPAEIVGFTVPPENASVSKFDGTPRVQSGPLKLTGLGDSPANITKHKIDGMSPTHEMCHGKTNPTSGTPKVQSSPSKLTGLGDSPVKTPKRTFDGMSPTHEICHGTTNPSPGTPRIPPKPTKLTGLLDQPVKATNHKFDSMSQMCHGSNNEVQTTSNPIPGTPRVLSRTSGLIDSREVRHQKSVPKFDGVPPTHVSKVCHGSNNEVCLPVQTTSNSISGTPRVPSRTTALIDSPVNSREVNNQKSVPKFDGISPTHASEVCHGTNNEVYLLNQEAPQIEGIPSRTTGEHPDVALKQNTSDHRGVLQRPTVERSPDTINRDVHTKANGTSLGSTPSVSLQAIDNSTRVSDFDGALRVGTTSTDPKQSYLNCKVHTEAISTSSDSTPSISLQAIDNSTFASTSDFDGFSRMGTTFTDTKQSHLKDSCKRTNEVTSTPTSYMVKSTIPSSKASHIQVSSNKASAYDKVRAVHAGNVIEGTIHVEEPGRIMVNIANPKRTKSSKVDTTSKQTSQLLEETLAFTEDQGTLHQVKVSNIIEGTIDVEEPGGFMANIHNPKQKSSKMDTTSKQTPQLLEQARFSQDQGTPVHTSNKIEGTTSSIEVGSIVNTSRRTTSANEANKECSNANSKKITKLSFTMDSIKGTASKIAKNGTSKTIEDFKELKRFKTQSECPEDTNAIIEGTGTSKIEDETTTASLKCERAIGFKAQSPELENEDRLQKGKPTKASLKRKPALKSKFFEKPKRTRRKDQNCNDIRARTSTTKIDECSEVLEDSIRGLSQESCSSSGEKNVRVKRKAASSKIRASARLKDRSNAISELTKLLKTRQRVQSHRRSSEESVEHSIEGTVNTRKRTLKSKRRASGDSEKSVESSIVGTDNIGKRTLWSRRLVSGDEELVDSSIEGRASARLKTRSSASMKALKTKRRVQSERRSSEDSTKSSIGGTANTRKRALKSKRRASGEEEICEDPIDSSIDGNAKAMKIVKSEQELPFDIDNSEEPAGIDNFEDSAKSVRSSMKSAKLVESSIGESVCAIEEPVKQTLKKEQNLRRTSRQSRQTLKEEQNLPFDVDNCEEPSRPSNKRSAISSSNVESKLLAKTSSTYGSKNRIALCLEKEAIEDVNVALVDDVVKDEDMCSSREALKQNLDSTEEESVKVEGTPKGGAFKEFPDYGGTKNLEDVTIKDATIEAASFERNTLKLSKDVTGGASTPKHEVLNVKHEAMVEEDMAEVTVKIEKEPDTKKDDHKTKEETSPIVGETLKRPLDGTSFKNAKVKSCPDLEESLILPKFKDEANEPVPKDAEPKWCPSGSRVPLWTPPKSPHNLIEETLYHNPWGLLVATIFLNKTSSYQAGPYIFDFLERYPEPSKVLEVKPKDLEPYFTKIGLKKRALQVWRMSHDFLHKKWRNVGELYGIGKYGEDAYRMFCLGDMEGVEPKDRFLKIYKAWYHMVERGKKVEGGEF